MPKRGVFRKQRGTPPRSLYRKIHLVLLEARRGKANSPKELSVQIRKRGHRDFTRPQLQPGHGVKSVPCSEESILRVVKLCVAIGLIDRLSANLTKAGTRAIDQARFDDVLRHQLTTALSDLGVPLYKIKGLASQALSEGKLESMPTWNSLLSRLSDSVDGRKFRTYLSLLGACEGISYSLKKIYLPR